jgi:biopolymer transport protein ExbD
VVVIEQKPTGLQTEIPQQANPKDPTIPPPNKTIVIQIHHRKSGAEHSLGEQSQVEHPLRDRLRDIFAIRVERIAYLKADDDIDFQDVADVIATARIAGVDRAWGCLLRMGNMFRWRDKNNLQATEPQKRLVVVTNTVIENYMLRCLELLLMTSVKYFCGRLRSHRRCSRHLTRRFGLRRVPQPK